MSDPLVSVIIPAYNAGNTVLDCVQSILLQTHTEIEVIVVDDGSSDGTLQVIADLQSRDSRLRLICQDNTGVSAARNAGLSDARGEWVAFVDADDFLPANAISTLLNSTLKADSVISVGAMSFDTVGSDGSIHEGPLGTYGAYSSKVCIRDDFEGLYAANYVQSSCAKLFSKSLLDDNCIRFDQNLDSFEDFVFVLDCLAVSPHMAVNDDVCYRYLRRLEGTGSTRHKSNMAAQMNNVADRLAGFYSEPLGCPWSKDCLCHIAQFFIVVVNNIQKSGFSRKDACRQLAAVAEMPVFARMLSEAEEYPNRYSNVVCYLVAGGHFGAALTAASLRNFVRSRHAA